MKRSMVFLLAALIGMSVFADDKAATLGTIGIVIMHGKGGSPMKHVADLGSALEEKATGLPISICHGRAGATTMRT